MNLNCTGNIQVKLLFVYISWKKEYFAQIESLLGRSHGDVSQENESKIHEKSMCERVLFRTHADWHPATLPQNNFFGDHF